MICENCFGDNFLADLIRTRGNPSNTDCSYCGTVNPNVISGVEITDTVYAILDLYTESAAEDAQHIWFYLRRDWKLLEKPNSESCAQIIDEVFPEEGISAKKFKSRQSQTLRLNLWDEFQNELKHKNRFFPQTKIIDPEELRNLFSFLILKTPQTNYYRARICEGKMNFSAQEMGRPPELKTKGGRANPIGISYLYSASDVETAIAEVRPNVGDQVCVAVFSANTNLTLLDLRSPRKTISPFAVDPDDLLRLLNELEFLCRLGEQLSKPVLPREAELEYLASQYLCEMIKHFAYDGVVYQSSVSAGFNIGFFNDEKIRAINEIQVFKVSSVQYIAEIFHP